MCIKCENMLKRRGFLKSTLEASALLMASTLIDPKTLFATTSNFPEGEKLENLITSKDLKLKNGEHYSIDIFVSRPKKTGNFKPILITHGFGDTTYLKYTATRLALAGYIAVALLDEKKVTDIDEKLVKDKRDEWEVTKEHLLTMENVVQNELAVLGFCAGGTLAMLEAAENSVVKVAISVYGDLSVSNDTLPEGTIEKIKIPVQAHFGLLDKVFPLESARNFEKLILKNNKKAEVYFYENCGHSYCNFSIPEGSMPRFDYNFDAAMKTYERIITFLKDNY